MRPSSCKAKGRRFQQELAAAIVSACGLTADDVTSRSSGAAGTDLLLSPAARAVFPYAVEAKNVESLNVWAAFTQAAANGTKTRLTPLLCIRRNKQEPLVILRLPDFLALVAERGVL